MIPNSKCLLRSLAVLFLLIIFVLAPALCLAAGRIGIVLLHGKAGTPDFMTNAAGRVLQETGFFVDTPEMAWSKNRYMDKTYEAALDEIVQAIGRLRRKGADKVVVSGYGMGGNAAFAYAVYLGKIDGVVLLAPEQSPDSPSYKKYQTDVAKARTMIDTGHGEQTAVFMEGDMGVGYGRNMKAAIYYSYFSPEGLGAVSKAAFLLNPKIPVLYIVGSRDPLTAGIGKSYVFDKLPINKLTRYVIIDTDHMGTPSTAVGTVIDWLKELAKQ